VIDARYAKGLALLEPRAPSIVAGFWLEIAEREVRNTIAIRKTCTRKFELHADESDHSHEIWKEFVARLEVNHYRVEGGWDRARLLYEVIIDFTDPT
jgi:hypothetical protein